MSFRGCTRLSKIWPLLSKKSKIAAAAEIHWCDVLALNNLFHLMPNVFQICKLKENMTLTKAGMAQRWRTYRSPGGWAKWLKAGRVTMVAELKQPDVSQISKLKEDMSPTKEDMLLLGQGMKGLNWFQMGGAGSHPGLSGAGDILPSCCPGGHQRTS